jgi:hypothetical protein
MAAAASAASQGADIQFDAGDIRRPKQPVFRAQVPEDLPIGELQELHPAGCSQAPQIFLFLAFQHHGDELRLALSRQLHTVVKDRAVCGSIRERIRVRVGLVVSTMRRAGRQRQPSRGLSATRIAGFN